MTTIKQKIQPLSSLYNAKHHVLREDYPELITALENANLRSIEVEGMLADVRILPPAHHDADREALVLVVECTSYVQVLGVDTQSDVAMQLIRLLAQATPGCFVDLNIWPLRLPDAAMTGWMRLQPLVSIREEGRLLTGVDEGEFWRNLQSKCDSSDTNNLDSQGTAQAKLRYGWHASLRQTVIQRFSEFAGRRSGDQRERMVAVQVEHAIEHAWPLYCDRDRDLSPITQVMVPIHRYDPNLIAKFAASAARSEGRRAEPLPARTAGRYSIH
jgi:hypothetical protein